jgi:hypothetical protein
MTMTGSGNVVPIRKDRNAIPDTTYGALAEANVTALEALLSEVKRTYSHVMWLEAYVADLPPSALFSNTPFDPTQEAEWAAHPEKRPQPGTIAYLLAEGKAKELATASGSPAPRTRNQVHLAVQQLLKERMHLVDVCSRAIRMGIALDEIEMAKQHGELLVQAMTKFAIASGLDPTDKNVVTAILTALDEVSEPRST